MNTFPNFVQLPDNDHYLLHRAAVPGSLLQISECANDQSNHLVEVDLEIRDSKIFSIQPSFKACSNSSVPAVNLDGMQVWPCYIDSHVHLDKSHTGARTFTDDRSLEGAIQADALDQQKYWTVEDLITRMDFALQCAYTHGTCAMRTHLISNRQTYRKTWKAYQQVKSIWSDRINLQAVSLALIEELLGEFGEFLADFTMTQNGILGCAIIGQSRPAIARQLDRVFHLAQTRQLDLDFHADENLAPQSHMLREIAEAKLRNNFTGNVAVGHCCSLSVQDEHQVQTTLELTKQANISIISLPTTNLYLQDRQPGRTPSRRGVTPVQEIVAKDIPLAFASDNCCDLFNLYGDYDLHQIYSLASLLCHLDLNMHQWPVAVTKDAAKIIGVHDGGYIYAGARANFILFNAKSYQALLTRPQSDRIVIRNGRPIDTRPPSFDLLRRNI